MPKEEQKLNYGGINMALTTCPECGGKLSTTVKNCIHCGCKITFCPECGMTLIGEPISCTECGYSFGSKNASQNQSDNDTNNNCVDNQCDNTYESTEESAPIAETPKAETASPCETENVIPPQSKTKDKKANTPKIPSAKEIIDNWKKDTSMFGYNVCKVFTVISSIIGTPLLIAAFIIFFISLINDHSISSFVTALICATIGLFFVRFATFFSLCQEAIANKKLWAWSKAKNIDLYPIIEKSLFTKVESMSTSEQKKYKKNMDLLIGAHCYNTIPLSKAKEIWMQLLSIISNTIAIPLFTAFIIINDSVISTSMFDLEQYSGWILLIVAIIVEALNTLIFEKAEKIAEKPIEEWVKKNFSSEAYTRYVSHIK